MKMNVVSLLNCFKNTFFLEQSFWEGKGSSEGVVCLSIVQMKQKQFSYDLSPVSSISINPMYFREVNKQEVNSFVTLKPLNIGAISEHSVYPIKYY